MSDVRTRVREAIRLALDLVLPPLCLSCRAIVSEPGSLCPACWQGITFLTPPACAACGLPFEFDAGPGAVCAACAAAPPPFRRARAVFRYDEASRALVLRFKHADRLEGAPAFGRWMARAGTELIADADVATPVPLHPLRLLGRRYNQAAVLALAVGKQAGLAVDPDLLVRRRPTPPMGHMGRSERARNVKGAFAVRERKSAAIQDRNVLLIDDVLTTGATVGECAKALLRAGAANVDVLTLGRVIR
ncbi:MAG: ComF family protein [Magnetospirillum sp.]|nr:ComF family protein [Magnetospirillum sp.]